jgi:hypothetical protein
MGLLPIGVQIAAAGDIRPVDDNSRPDQSSGGDLAANGRIHSGGSIWSPWREPVRPIEVSVSAAARFAVASRKRSRIFGSRWCEKLSSKNCNRTRE